MGAPNAGGFGKNCVFDLSRSLWLIRLTGENLCPSSKKFHIHDGALAEEYEV